MLSIKKSILISFLIGFLILWLFAGLFDYFIFEKQSIPFWDAMKSQIAVALVLSLLLGLGKASLKGKAQADR